MADAQRMAGVAQQATAFPITMNDRVLEQLNVLLGTPDGRAYLHASLMRMGRYEAIISERIKDYGLPPELIAVPLAESGYRNLPADTDARHGAGLWMFIESTAKHYGLEVTQSEDERLDVLEETEAAMRMLSSLQLRFNDWNLGAKRALADRYIGRARELSDSRSRIGPSEFYFFGFSNFIRKLSASPMATYFARS